MDGATEKECFQGTTKPDDVDAPPTWTFKQEECDARPGFYEYVATIVYTVYNDNTLDFTPRPAFLDSNYVRYSNNRDLGDTKNLEPAGWDGAIPANSIKVHTETRIMKPCESKRGTSNAMDGLLAKDFPNYCRCFVREWVTSVVTPIEESDPPSIGQIPNPTSAPSANPSIVISPAPSANPSPYALSPPTVDPTPTPSSPPIDDPTQASKISNRGLTQIQE